jgi:stearoyl-CoA desaturase (Delta-9 desaturase)
MTFLFFFVALWYLSLFSQTFFQHRYAAHGAFTMSRGWERFFYLFSYVTQGSSYMSPRAYAIMHRMHHAYTDTQQDPHSPSFSPNLMAMMLRTRNFYSNIFKRKYTTEARFMKNLPDWPAFDKWAHSSLSRLLWIFVYIGIFIWLSPPLWLAVLLPVVVTMGAFHGAIINWFAHKYGYKNFSVTNTSTNLFSVDLLMLGEAYHNNHHQNPKALNFGRRWHEIDPVYPFIKLFLWLKIIKINNTTEAEAAIAEA